jgi:hypothetical protein
MVPWRAGVGLNIAVCVLVYARRVAGVREACLTGRKARPGDSMVLRFVQR